MVGWRGRSTRWREREEVKPCSLSKIRTFHSNLCNPSNTNQVQYLGYVIHWKHVASSLGGQRVSLACVHGLGGTVASWCCPVSGGLSISRHRFHEKINHPRNKVDALKLEQSLLPSKMTWNKLPQRYFDTSQITSLCTLFSKTPDVCAISFSLFSISGHRSLLSQHMTQTAQFKI